MSLTADVSGGGRRLLLSMPEIAELAGVNRPVVTTWRRRHTKFPEPVAATGSAALFDANEVCDWLVATGRADRVEIEINLHAHALSNLAPQLPTEELAATITALICLRHVDDDLLVVGDLVARAREVDPTDDFLLSEIRALPSGATWAVGAIDDLIEAMWGCAGAFELVMRSHTRLGISHLSRDVVSPELARLIAGLAGAKERSWNTRPVLVADPAAGLGDLLTAVVQSVGSDRPPAIVAAEQGYDRIRLIRRRLTVHNVYADELHVGAEPDVEAQPHVVVTQLPYHPRESRSPHETVAALDEVALALAPGSTAVVLGPADVLIGPLRAYSGPERHRSNILTSGFVEAVIRLPGGLIQFRPGYETALWVLTAPAGQQLRPHVLVADVSDRELSSDIADQLVADIVTWRADGYRHSRHTPAVCAENNVHDLVDPPRALTVRARPTPRQLVEEVPATVSHVADLEVRLDALTTPRPNVRSGLAATPSTRHSRTTIGLLVREGRLGLIRGSRISAADVRAVGAHPIVGRRELCEGGRIGGRLLDRAVLADRYPRIRLTEPGDVIVTAAPRLAVYVDHEGFKVVEFPARALHIPPSERTALTPRVLGALLAAGRDGRRAAGAIRAPRRLEDWEVPLLGADLTARLDRLLENVDERRRVAEEELAILDQLGRIAISGLTDGTLTIQH